MESLSASALQWVRDNMSPEALAEKDDHGLIFSGPVHRAPLPAVPLPAEHSVATLSGLRELVEVLAPGEGSFALVGNERRVEVFGPEEPIHRKRPLRAIAAAPVVDFPFARFFSLEEFRIAVACAFQDSMDRGDLLSTLARVRAGGHKLDMDDGISQRVEVNRGISELGLETIRPTFLLQQFCTFPELEQPVREFLLRMKTEGGDDGTVKAALFESGGASWQHPAALAIQAHLKAEGFPLPVVA